MCEALIQREFHSIMTTVTTKKNHDQDKVNEISEKLMENPELAKLIGELSTSTGDASDLVKGLLQASINAGLQAEMDAHVGYRHSDRKINARLNQHRVVTTATGRTPKLCASATAGRDYGDQATGRAFTARRWCRSAHAG